MGTTNNNMAYRRLATAEDRLWPLIATAPALTHTALPTASVDYLNRRRLGSLSLARRELRGRGQMTNFDPDYFVELAESSSAEY